MYLKGHPVLPNSFNLADLPPHLTLFLFICLFVCFYPDRPLHRHFLQDLPSELLVLNHHLAFPLLIAS